MVGVFKGKPEAIQQTVEKIHAALSFFPRSRIALLHVLADGPFQSLPDSPSVLVQSTGQGNE